MDPAIADNIFRSIGCDSWGREVGIPFEFDFVKPTQITSAHEKRFGPKRWSRVRICLDLVLECEERKSRGRHVFPDGAWAPASTWQYPDMDTVKWGVWYADEGNLKEKRRNRSKLLGS